MMGMMQCDSLMNPGDPGPEFKHFNVEMCGMAQTFEEISYVGSLPMTLSQCNVSDDIFPQSILGED